MDGSQPGSPVRGISQANELEWVAISFSSGSSQPRDQTHVSFISCSAGGFFITEPPGKPQLPAYYSPLPLPWATTSVFSAVSVSLFLVCG